MMGESIASVLSGLPTIWKATTALVGAIGIGASGMAFVLSAQIADNAEGRVTNAAAIERIEVRLGAIEEGVRLNNCLELADRNGQNWRTCLEGGTP